MWTYIYVKVTCNLIFLKVQYVVLLRSRQDWRPGGDYKLGAFFFTCMHKCCVEVSEPERGKLNLKRRLEMIRAGDAVGSRMPGPWQKNKNPNVSIIIFFPPSTHDATVGRRLARLLLRRCFDFIPFIFHLSVNASSNLPSGSETACPFSLLQHWDYHAVCASQNRKGGSIVFFPSALETNFGFSGKAPRWALPKNTAGGCWLEKAGAVSPFLTLLLMPILSCPCHCSNRFVVGG